MRLLSSLPLLLLCAGCAAHVAPSTTEPVRSERADAVMVPTSPPPAVAPSASPVAAEPVSPSQAPAPAAAVAEAPPEQPAAGSDAADAPDGDADDDNDSAEVAGFDSTEADEAEAPEAGPGTPAVQFTADLSDAELEKRWKGDPASLGSVSVGFVHAGRMVNAVQFPTSSDWLVVQPEKAWTTEETVHYLTQVIRELRARYPDAPLLRVNQISARDGGYIRPHKSHQNGRDVDLGFFYPNGNVVRARARENYIDPVLNWALIRALVTHADVQVILVDRRVQKVLYDHALKIGEDKAWLDSLFHAGENSLIKHARGHRDHFHVRFFNPRAQELGRRLAPLLALQPEHNIAMHRVRSGDTLGAIAMRYNSTVTSIRNANRVRGTLLHIGQVLSVPLRGPCTRCPVPPPVVVPPRRLPLDARIAAKPQGTAAGVKAEETAEPKPQVTAAVGVKAEAEAQPEVKSEVKPEAQPEVKPEAQPEVKEPPTATVAETPGS